ncbi:hypothetical protein V8C86DRAFT_314522 [Haematococcus lacustris]
MLQLHALLRQETALAQAVAKRQAEGGSSSDAAVLAAKLKMVRLARLLRVGAIVQNLADASLAINDIRANKDPILSHPLILAVAGLVSGSISGYKNWVS